MSVTRADMLDALKTCFVPALRDLKFKGTMPHFYRVRGDHVDLASVQFSGGGGEFIVEIAFMDAARTNGIVGRRGPPDAAEPVRREHDEPPASMRVASTAQRLRLGASTHADPPERRGDDFWFNYRDGSRGSYEKGVRGAPAKLASLAARLLVEQGEPWWRSHHA